MMTLLSLLQSECEALRGEGVPTLLDDYGLAIPVRAECDRVVAPLLLRRFVGWLLESSCRWAEAIARGEVDEPVFDGDTFHLEEGLSLVRARFADGPFAGWAIDDLRLNQWPEDRGWFFRTAILCKTGVQFEFIGEDIPCAAQDLVVLLYACGAATVVADPPWALG